MVGFQPEYTRRLMSMTAQPSPRMVKQTYIVRFVTPAFLGNVEQQGQWRTPPFKALRKQRWYR
jgi:CRISPR-associated protein Cmr1